jgi:hypothetical protein
MDLASLEYNQVSRSRGEAMPKPTFSQPYYRNEIRPIFNNRVALHTRYGGLLTVREAWDWLEVNQIQRDAGLQWGGEPPEVLSFTCAVGPLVGAFSMKAVAEKFSVESKDALLAVLFKRHPGWYTYRRYLTDWRFDWYGFTQAVTQALLSRPLTTSKVEGQMILDDVVVPKWYAEEMEHLSNLKDPCTGHIGPAYDIVNLGYVDDQKFLPLAFRFRIKSEKELAPGFERPKGEPSDDPEVQNKLDLALAMLRWAKKTEVNTRYLVFDGWWSVFWFLHELQKLGLWWIGKIRRDRRVRRLDGQVGVVGEFAEAIALYDFPKLGVDAAAYWGYLLPPAYDKRRPPLPAKFVVVRHLREGDDESGETEEDARKLKTLITGQRDLTISETVTRYQDRWPVEVFHRDGKQHLGLGHFHMRSFQGISGHVAHVYLLYVLLTVMRLRNPWLTKLAISQLIEDFIHVICDVELVDGQPSLILRPDYAFFQVLAEALGDS